jgi:hypothetical protein
MTEETTNENQLSQQDNSGVKWAWIVIFLVTSLATTMFEGENLTYGFGHACGAFVIGLIISPIGYLILKKFIKIKWMWYHWFNIAASIGFGLDVLRWILVPMARGL